MIFALVLGCFAGAAAGDTWGKDESGPKLTLSFVYPDGAYPDSINGAYVSNTSTPTHYLFINDNILSYLTELECYIASGYSISFPYWYSDPKSALEGRNAVFNSDGELSATQNLPYLNNGDWNYSYLYPVSLYAPVYANSTRINFNPNGGKFLDSEGVIPGDVYYSDNIISIHPDGFSYSNPTHPEGKPFLGWGLKSDGDLITTAKYDTISEKHEDESDSWTVTWYEIPLEGTVSDYVQNGKWVYLGDNEGELTLYAIWGDKPSGGSSAIILIGSKSSSSGSGPHIEHKYVTFDANGGLGEMEKQQFTGGQTKALSANQFTFAGKNFAGWALEPTGMVTYSDGQEIMVEEDITLYAVWVEPIPENPDVGGDGEDETGIPTWLAVLLVAVVLAILIAVLVYFLVIRRGAA